MIRAAPRISAALALAVVLALPRPAAAQTLETSPKPGPTHHKPQDKGSKAAAPKSSPQTPPAEAPANASAGTNGRVLDLAYGAYQRGLLLTAFMLATDRVNQRGDPKAMTLLGEL